MKTANKLPRELIKFCQNKLGECDSYTDFNGKTTEKRVKLWNSYNSITISWGKMSPEVRILFLQVCDGNLFINFEYKASAAKTEIFSFRKC